VVKFLLIPLGIFAFVLFLLLLGAIGLAVAMAVLWVFGRLWSLVNRRGYQPRS
jgi:hypothetical protein